MSTQWEKDRTNSMRKFSFLKRLLYTIGGYPIMPQELPAEDWKNWEKRFQESTYDWSHHSGGVQKPGVK